MTYEKIFSDVKKAYSKADKSKLSYDFAFQFNITGEGEGIFYVAFRGGILEIAPYDYVDRNTSLYATGEVFLKLAQAKITFEEAVDSGSIGYEGDYDLANILNQLAYSGSVSNSSSKKPKKEAASKGKKNVKEEKPAVKKTEKATKSVPEKKI